jgi:hypothetical protein
VYTCHVRKVLATTVMIVGLALTATAVSAKGGVVAIADRPVDLAADAGTRMHVAWHLVDDKGRPFGASRIYLRVSRCGQKPLLITARYHGRGHYTARFTVPRGGIRKLMVGLTGWSITQGEKKRADAIFNFVPALGRRCS